MTTASRTLLLLRHATAEPGRPGGRDADRPLSAHGRGEASGVGDFLRESGLQIDHVLCSPALRTRQTLEQLELDAGLGGPTIDVVRQLYLADAEQLVELVDALPATTVLVVGHAPAVPETVALLAGAGPPRAAAAVSTRYPPATLARLRSGPEGFAPHAAALVGVRLADGRGGQYFD